MDISKEYIEKLLGYEVNDFSIEFKEGIININVVPKQSVEYVDVDVVIKTSLDKA